MRQARSWRGPILAAAVLAVGGVMLGSPAQAVPGPELRSVEMRAASTAELEALVRATAPLELTDQITDRAGVLTGSIPALERELQTLLSEHELQLFAVFVDSFDGLSGDAWAQQTYSASGMGGNDVLLAVAVADGRYATWTTTASGLTAQEDALVRTRYIEPALRRSDWSGAVSAAVEGYAAAANNGLARSGRSSGGGVSVFGLTGFLLLPLLIPIALILLFVGFWRRASRAAVGYRGQDPEPRSGPPRESLDDLGRRAASALVAVDDAIRSSSEELSFAEAQFGVQATRRFKEALEQARHKASEAFRLQRQLDDDEAAGTLDDNERWRRLQHIIALASEADADLDAQEAEFVRMRDLQARVPAFLRELRVRLPEVQRRVPVAEQELAGLAAQHPSSALTTVSGNVTQAQSLLASAEEFIDTGEKHLSEGDNRAAAVAAARAAEEAIGQADALLTSVSNARDELAQAASRLDAALASLSSDIADAERLGADDQLTRTALAAAQSALEQGTGARDGGDPLAALRALGRAEHDLDNALARYRAEDQRRTKSRELLNRRIEQVWARLDSIDDSISRHRGAVGRRARTFIIDAIGLYRRASDLVETDPVRAAELLDRAEATGERALEAAQEDIDSFGGHRRGGPVVGLDPTALILGGILAGGLGRRGGGWGGTTGGFGGGFGGGGSFGGGGGGFGGGGRF